MMPQRLALPFRQHKYKVAKERQSWKTQESTKNLVVQPRSWLSLLTDSRLQVRSGTNKTEWRQRSFISLMEPEPVTWESNSLAIRTVFGVWHCRKVLNRLKLWSDVPESIIQEDDKSCCELVNETIPECATLPALVRDRIGVIDDCPNNFWKTSSSSFVMAAALKM